MNQLFKTFSLTFMLLALFIPAVAQRIAPRPNDKSAIDIYRRYDKSKDETVTETGIMPIDMSSEGPVFMGALDLNVFYTYQGTSPVAPLAVTIKINSTYPGFQARHDLVIAADGETFQLGKMQYRKRAGGNNTPGVMYGRNGPADSGGMPGFTGEMTMVVPVETFKRIASAKKVHFKIGPMDRDLQDYHLEKMRALVSAMTQ